MVNQPGVGVCVRVVLVCRRVCRRVCRPVCARAPMMVTEGLRRRLGWEHSIVHEQIWTAIEHNGPNRLGCVRVSRGHR